MNSRINFSKINLLQEATSISNKRFAEIKDTEYINVNHNSQIELKLNINDLNQSTSTHSKLYSRENSLHTNQVRIYSLNQSKTLILL